MHQAVVITARKAPRVCMPDPNVRSHGKKIFMLIIGGMASTITMEQASRTALFRDSLLLSMMPPTCTSRAATADRKAAPNRPVKNNRPKIPPNGICLNVCGKVKKISDGPLSGSRPKANTAGKMASPARSPASVSPRPVRTAIPGIFSESSIYEP